MGSVCGRFQDKTTTFQKVIPKFIRQVTPVLFEPFVSVVSSLNPMYRVVTPGQAFRHYPCARYTADVTFQQKHTLANTLDLNYSAQHKFHGVKIDVGVAEQICD